MKATLKRLQNALKVREAGGAGLTSGPAVHDIRGSMMNFGTYRWVLLVVALVAAYYLFWASDRYLVTTSLYVKSTDGAGAGVPQLQLLTGPTESGQDASIVKEYILSNDMLDHLQETMKIGDHFSSGEWDLFSRMEGEPSREEFLKYYRSRVSVSTSLESSIFYVRVQAFTPEYSKRLLEEIVREAERFVNELSQELARQEISFVEGEISRAKNNVDALRERVLRFQNENGLLSPEVSGAALQEAVNTLEAELIQLRTAEKAQSSFLNDDAAELVTTRAKISAIEDQLKVEKLRLASDEQASINDAFAEFKQMEFELNFASEVYATTLVSAETARVEAYKKIKHLVVVEKPFLPEDAVYPRAIYNLITLFVALSLAYGIIIMIIATIREHRDV
jgi:capsular polysaccharide transport system permease protein